MIVRASQDPVVVVGGGLVGLCTALYLRRAGSAVTLIERGDPGGGASAGNAGSISPGSVAPVGYPGMLRDVPRMLFDPHGPLRITPRGALADAGWLWRFLRASSRAEVQRSAEGIAPFLSTTLAAHRELAEMIGAQDLLKTTGQLQIYPDRASYGKDANGWRLRHELGVAFNELRREEILQYEPAIGPGYTFGVFLPDAGMVVNPRRYGERIAETLTAEGGRLVRDEATGFEFEGDRVTAVQGRVGRYPCAATVVAAGAWSARLLRRYGYRIPLINQRGYHLEFPEPGVAPRRVVAAADRKLFITPMETGLRVAGTVEITPIDTPPNFARARGLMAGAKVVYPSLQTASVREWSGERPCLPDSLPVMGRGRKHANLWFNFGHGHLGLTMSAAAGRAIARSLTTEHGGPDIKVFAYDRFSS